MLISSIVDNYIAENRPKLARHLAHYSSENASSFEEAIRRAAYAEWDQEGRKHEHQYRLPRAASQEIHQALLNARTQLSKSKTFLQLYGSIHELLLPVHGAGPLMEYDTALRLGAYLGIEPEDVFTQRGVKKGLQEFFRRFRPGSAVPNARYLPREIFLPELSDLSAKEIENFLCSRANELKGLPQQSRKTGAC